MTWEIKHGDALAVLRTIPCESVHCCVTSPPYWGLRDYGVAGQLGLERTPDEYVAKVVEGFREVRRVLRKDGTLFLNLGDSYFSNPAKGGSGTPNGRNGRGEGYGRALRAAAYGTSGKVPEGSQDRGCLCGSLCDACRVAYRTGKSHSGSRPSAMPSPSLSAPIRERMESEHGHPPTLGCSLPVGRNVASSSDREKTSGRASEQPRASRLSMKPQSSAQSQGGYSQDGSQDGRCLLCARTLGDCVRESVHRSGETEVTSAHTEGNALPSGELERNTQYTCEYCSIGDSRTDYTTAYLKPKDLCGIPWMVAFALRADGWYLRQDIIWAKPNPMPESVTDRCTKSHEYLFLLSKGPSYYCDMEAIKEESVTNDIRRPYTSEGAWQMDGRPPEQRHGGEPRSFRGSQFNTGKTSEHQLGRSSRKVRHPAGWKSGNGSHDSIHENGREHEVKYVENTFEKRNRRSVWEIATSPFPEAHFATFPPKLVEPCILAGCPEGGTVLDPFAGAGTTGLVATRLNRNFIGIELNVAYIEMANRRIEQDRPLFNTRERETPLRGASPDIWK